MLFLYLFTTSLPLSFSFLRLYSVVWLILLIVSVVGGEYSAHSCDSCRLSCVEVTRGWGENGRNFWCNMGATQPIGIFLPPSSRNFTPFCGFAIFWNLFVMVHAMELLASCLLPTSSLPPQSIFPIIVWMDGLPGPDVLCSTYPLVSYSPPYPPPVPIIISPSLST